MPLPIIDIILIAVVAIGAIFGLWKGFFKSIISLFGWVVSLIVAILLARTVASFLLDIPAISRMVLGGGEGWSLAGMIESWLPASLQNIPAGEATGAVIEEAMGSGIWARILTPLIDALVGAVAAESGLMLCQLVGVILANNIFIIFVGAGLMVALRVVMILFTKIAEKLRKNKVIRAADRLGGFFVGIAKSCVYIFMAFFALSFVIASDFMTPVRNHIDNTVITRRVSNGVFLVIDRYFYGDDGFLQGLLDRLGLGGGSQGSEDCEECENDPCDCEVTPPCADCDNEPCDCVNNGGYGSGGIRALPGMVFDINPHLGRARVWVT